MFFVPAAVFCGTLLMTQAGELTIEPGKQLPQSLTVQTSNDPDHGEVNLRYLLFTPANYKSEGPKWPLLLFLHGLGESSDDELNLVKVHGPAKIVESQPDFPFVLVTPQCSPPKPWSPGKPFPATSAGIIDLVANAWDPDKLVLLLDHVRNCLNIDPDRVYVTGLSMGGYGTWRLVARYPDRFAAAVPICGGGNPATMADAPSRVPIWAFHGAKDPTIPLTESERMVQAVQRAGGDVKFTVYPDVAHNSWTQTYENQEVYNWLLSHRRKPK
jgi:predicted peptidase